MKTKQLHKTLILAGLALLPAPVWGYSPDNQDSPLGINLAGTPSWGTDWTFVDAFKVARSWISQQSGQPWGEGPALDLDAEGWVRSLQTDCWVDTPMLDGVADAPAGEYVVIYEGEGTMTFSGSAVLSATPDGPGRILLDVDPSTGSGIWLKISDLPDPGNYIRHIKVIMPGFEATHLTQPFHPSFLDVWKEFRMFRFMDWLETNNSPIVNWDDRETLTTHGKHGNALEHMNMLCNTLLTDAWVCVPHQATDDFVKKMAILLRSGYDMGSTDVSGTEGADWFLSDGTQVCDPLDSSLKVYIEYSNECWNGIFSQAQYCEQEGVALYPEYEDTPWEAAPLFYSERSVEIFQIFEEVFGGVNRLQRVMAWQVGSHRGITILDHQNAYEYSDYLAIAPYFGGILDDGYHNGEYVGDWTTDQVLDVCEDQIYDIMSTAMRQVNEAGARTNLQGNPIKLIHYEAGQHLVGTGGMENDDTLTALFQACNRADRMKEVYLDYMALWRDAGAEIIGIFSSMGEYSKWGSWGILENHGEDPMTKPKYVACMQFIDGNDIWWEQTPPAPIPDGTLLIDFQGTFLPAGITANRTLQDIGSPPTMRRIDFSTATGDHLFNCPGYEHGEFYGGYVFDYGTADISSYTTNLNLSESNDRFESWTDAGDGIYSKMASLLMWRKDQFNNSSATQVGKLKVNVSNVGFGELRFVIRNGSTYYISSFMTNHAGTFELTEFNNSSDPWKQWKVWNPTAADFAMPEEIIGFSPMLFDDVTEVGLAHFSERDSWSHNYNFGLFQAWEMSPEEFTVRIDKSASQADPTSVSPVNFTAVFNKPTSDFITGDVTVGGTAMATDHTVTEISPFDGTSYEVAVTGMTLTGNVVADIDAGVCTDGTYPNRAASSARNFALYIAPDPPTCTIDQASGQADPTGVSPILFKAVFSEMVTGFEDGDVNVSGTAGASGSIITEISPYDGTTYEVAISDMAQDGTVIADIPAGVCVNGLGSGNLASTSTDNQVTYDTTSPPEVTIDQAAGQADPTSDSPVYFTVIFSQAVTGFEDGDVTLGGTAGAATAWVSETSPFNDTTYTVAVSGMTAAGTVTADIPAGACVSISEGTPNNASTSTDNTVNYSAESAGGTLIDFDGANVPDGPSQNRTFTETDGGQTHIIYFSTAEGDHFWTTGESQSEFYGGAKFNMDLTSFNFNWQLRTVDPPEFAPNQFYAYMGDGGESDRSRMDFLFMWRKAQFLNGMDTATVAFDDSAASKMSINVLTVNPDNAELRFVVRNASTYYLSEFSASTVELHELSGFNNSDVAGERWGVFNPASDDFDIPNPLPTFNAVDFNDVTEVGFIYYGERAGWGNGFQFDTFTTDAVTIPPPATIQFSQASYSVDEANETVQATLIVTRSGDSSGAVGVTYGTSEVSAVDGVDYTGTSGSLNWASGEKDPKTFTIDILSNPETEGDETLNATLSGPTGGASLGTPGSATLTIVDWAGETGPPPMITVTPSGTDLTLGFPTVSGKLYRLMKNTATPDLADGGGTATGDELTGDGTTMSFIVPKPATGQVFYTVEHEE